MVLLLYGNCCARMKGKKLCICYCSRFKQMSYTDQITEIATYVRIYS